MTKFFNEVKDQAAQFLESKNGKVAVGVVATLLALYGAYKLIKRKD